MPVKAVIAACAMMIALVFLTPARADTEIKPEVAAVVERLLGAIGGRDAWAGLTGTINDSQQNRVAEPTVVRAVISMDFTAPRFRIDTRGDGFSTVRVIDGARSWRKTREGVVEDVPAELFDEDMRWYGAHLYRTLHRIAARDPAFAYRLGEDGRLEVLENGARLIWFQLDARGEPYAYGAGDNDVGQRSGPWDFSDGAIRHPIWTANASGTWRANIKALQVNPPLADDLFKRPARQKEPAGALPD